MAMTALELGLRGAVVALFLEVCAVLLLRYAAVHRAAYLGATMGVAGAAYAISTAPFFSRIVIRLELSVRRLRDGLAGDFLVVGARDVR
ncbi:hypothetical protein [Bradyrhizobium sp. USDA 3364]